MKTTVNFYSFCDAFSEYNKDHFSYEWKRALFDYLEDYEDQTGEEVELDTVALCCEYSEYENLEELQKEHDGIKNFEDLEYETTVIYFVDYQDEENWFIIACF